MGELNKRVMGRGVKFTWKVNQLLLVLQMSLQLRLSRKAEEVSDKVWKVYKNREL